MKDSNKNRRSFIQSLLGTGFFVGLQNRRAESSENRIGLALPICTTCGTQFPHHDGNPDQCPVCEDDRQYVRMQGQQWTTLASVQTQHSNKIKQWEPGVYSIHTSPKFGIGQRAFLIQTPKGNVLWDCVSLIDEATITKVNELGGIDAIAISHPHYYSSMIEWSRAFHHAPIYLHQNDAKWVIRNGETIHFWSGDSLNLFDRITLVHTPGHFDGFQVLHMPGILFAGDQPQVCMDRNWVSFMYSYPNYIPLAKHQIQHITETLTPFDFDKIYGAFPHQNVLHGAKDMVLRSAERYIQSIT